MALTPNFNQADIKAQIEKKMAAYRNAIIRRLQQAGEKFVNLARDSGNYIDQTGNLRSSIGYLITYDGMPLFEAFPGSSSEGVTQGKNLAQKEAADEGYCLVGVAGMDYAAAVESKGKDVITGSSQQVEIWLRNAIATLKNKL